MISVIMASALAWLMAHPAKIEQPKPVMRIPKGEVPTEIIPIKPPQ